MPADPVLSRELKSLQEEILASHLQRQAPPADRPTASPSAASQAQEADDKQKLTDELRAFVDEVTKFFDEAEKSVAAHPAASMIGAFVAGVLVGRLLGRR